MAVIEVKNLRKEYKINKKKEGVKGAIANLFKPQYENKVAVKDISFSVAKGEMIGYIGANGAGKSTTIKMLTGILSPTSGQVLINGIQPNKNRVKNNIQIAAVFGQRSQLWWDIPVIESFKLIKKMYEVNDDDFEENLNYFNEVLDLDALLTMPVRQLSLGQKMKCEIAAAFIHNPKIVYLDEPTIGLDVAVKEKIREFIKTINKERNTTVILTTHDMQDIEEICERIIIIDDGNIIYDDSIDQIKNQFGNEREIKFKVTNVRNGLNEVLGHNKDLLLRHIDEHNIHVQFSGNKITARDIMDIIAPYCEIIDLMIQEESIENIVKELYRKEKNI